VCAGVASAAAAGTTLTINVGTQQGSFTTGDDVGELNAHDYRPGEFVTNDFIYEGLTEWDGEHPAGVDGISGNDDDFVKPSLAESWTTNYDAVKAGTDTRYEVTFYLTPGVTFHDGEKWDAAACKANFDHILGGDGVGPPPSYGSSGRSGWALTGLHDWMGFTQQVYGWEAVGDMTFKLTLTTYYEALFRELAIIRPVRMMSPLVLPSLEDNELSHNRFRCSGPRPRTDDSCFPRGDPSRLSDTCTGSGCNFPFPFGCDHSEGECYVMRGMKAPVGTGPYQVISKTLSTGETVPASDFNSSCYHADPTSPPPYLEQCRYDGDATVSEVLFTKFAGHRKNPTYDNVVLKSYDNVKAVKAALQDGSLDIAYGVQTLSPSAFIALATAEEGEKVVAHKATHSINTRLIVLNSGGALNSVDLRKLVMGILAANRQDLYDGELAEEEPMDTLFDPSAPHCSSLSDVDSITELTTMTSTQKTTLTTSLNAALTARATASGNAEDGKLRFMYKPSIPHEAIIASYVVSQLALAGISVHPIPVDKDGYNSLNCNYMQPVYSYNDNGDDGVAGNADDHNCDDSFAAMGFASAQECYSSYHGWDLAYSETWGAPYDPTSKLWDMTHGHFSGWCSQEADAPAVTNMASMTIQAFGNNVRALSTTIDTTAREALYETVLTTLHNEAIFLPLTAKRQTAVTSSSVSGFKFGWLEFDLPLSNLYPTPGPSNGLSTEAIIGIAVGASVGVILLTFIACLITNEKQGHPIFTRLDKPSPEPATRDPKTATSTGSPEAEMMAHVA
jgi:ABC-type transport system substrate-binding protein